MDQVAPADGLADRPHGMRPSEIGMLCKLVRDYDCRRILEIGMANGSSTVGLLRTLHGMGGGEVTSIDPFQYRAASNDIGDYGTRGAGMENVRRAGLSSMHRLIEDYDYIALAELVGRHERFDLIFVDGYHAFDYTFIDTFFADLLLKDGGICAFHDTASPAVNKVIRFLIRNKPYRIIGPVPLVYTADLPRRILRRVASLVTGRAGDARERRTTWHSLAAVQKLRSAICPELSVVDF